MMCNRFDLAMMRYNEQSTPAVERPTVSEVEKVEKDPIDSGSNTMEGKTVNNDFSSLKVPFPWKLWQMLEDSEKHGTENISAWLPSGDGFTISKTQEFATTLMKAHMQYSSYAAFVEELARYGFVMTREKSNNGLNWAETFRNPRYSRQDKTRSLGLRRKCTPRKLSDRLTEKNRALMEAAAAVQQQNQRGLAESLFAPDLTYQCNMERKMSRMGGVSQQQMRTRVPGALSYERMELVRPDEWPAIAFDDDSNSMSLERRRSSQLASRSSSLSDIWCDKPHVSRFVGLASDISVKHLVFVQGNESGGNFDWSIGELQEQDPSSSDHQRTQNLDFVVSNSSMSLRWGNNDENSSTSHQPAQQQHMPESIISKGTQSAHYPVLQIARSLFDDNRADAQLSSSSSLSDISPYSQLRYILNDLEPRSILEESLDEDIMNTIFD